MDHHRFPPHQVPPTLYCSFKSPIGTGYTVGGIYARDTRTFISDLLGYLFETSVRNYVNTTSSPQLRYGGSPYIWLSDDKADAESWVHAHMELNGAQNYDWFIAEIDGQMLAECYLFFVPHIIDGFRSHYRNMNYLCLHGIPSTSIRAVEKLTLGHHGKITLIPNVRS
jgi:hypothetical protein